MDHPILFKDWAELRQAALSAAVTYGCFIVLLRASGKRTLSKLNVFDFVFVVALGSTLADTVLSSDATVAKGLVACGTLVLFQLVLSKLAVHSPRLDQLINGEPALLLHRGQFLHRAMRKERITEEEIRAAIRAHNLASFDDVKAVVLETDGTLTVVWRKPDGARSALDDVVRPDRPASAPQA